ncbi:MAG TPA: SprB repeat-containing protein, partial [Saprospiraceae bacterium]|nr:SprB repeat-containing protein [Saprospiraceae bacterium]
MISIYATPAAVRRSVFSIFTLLLAASSALAQPVTTSWIFDNNVLTGTSTQPAVTANNATYGPGVTSQGFSAGNPSTGRAISGAGWGTGSPSTFLADDYFGFSFTVAATPCQVVKLTNLTFDSQRSSTGPATWEVRTSLDNFAAAVATGSNPLAFAMQTAALTQTVTAGQTFEVRVYGYGATGTGGTLRLDNVNLNGTIQTGPSAAVISGSGTFCLSGNLNFSVAVTGGTGPYTVVYTDGTNNFTQNNYSSGATISRNVTQTTTFTLVSVTDANGCAAPNLSGSATATVSTNPPVITFAVTQPTCANNDGAINATITGGTSPLTYTWSTVGGSGLVQGQEDQTGLSAGEYTLVVSDPFNCSDSETATLNIPANCADCPSASVISIVNVDCNHPTGSITFGASGGNPPYQFNIGGGAQSSGVFSGLNPGTYTVTVTDAGNCTQTVTASATVQNLPDTQAPNFDQNPLPQNLNLSCTDAVPPAATLTATDNCDGPVPVTFSSRSTPG